MGVADVLSDAFGRVREAVHAVARDLTEDQLSERLDAGANSIAWLCWHLTRVMDDHIGDAFGLAQVWDQRDWATRFGLSAGDRHTGYGHDAEQVSRVRATAETIIAYYDAVHEQALRHVGGVTGEDLTRIVDTRWDPPVTLGVRLVSVIADCLEHAGQAAFIRGSLLRRTAA